MTVGLLITLLTIWILLRYLPIYKKEDLHPLIIPSAFILKFFTGILVIWIHEHVYRMDDFSHDGQRFLREGEYLYNVFSVSATDYFKLLTGIGETPELISKYLHMTNYWSAGDLTLINDSKNVIRMHSLIHFFSGGIRLIHVAVFCFFSLFGLIALHKAFARFIHMKKGHSFILLLIVPSTIFWSSSMMKEPFLFLGIGLFCFGLLGKTSRTIRIISILTSLILLIGFKPYVLVCLLATLLFIAWYNTTKQRLVISFFSFFLLIGIAAYLLPNMRSAVVHHLTRKQFDFINVGQGGLHVQADSTFYYFQPYQYNHLRITGNVAQLIQPTEALYYRVGSKESPEKVFLSPSEEKWPIVYFKPGCESYIEITRIDESAVQLIKNIPEALFNTILRPLPFDNGSQLKYFAMFEVWLIIGLIIFTLFNKRTLEPNEKQIAVGLVFFALSLFVLIGWTTPVIGAIARYRFPAQLAIIVCCLLFIDTSKWKKNMW